MIKENVQQYIPSNAKIEFCNNVAFFEVPVSQIKEVVGDLHGK